MIYIYILCERFQKSGSVGNRTQTQPSKSDNPPPSSSDQSRCAKFDKLLGQTPVNMADLESLSWSGVPQRYRTKVWKLLCGYLPASQSEQVRGYCFDHL